jgi:hypothetical protein
MGIGKPSYFKAKKNLWNDEVIGNLLARTHNKPLPPFLRADRERGDGKTLFFPKFERVDYLWLDSTISEISLVFPTDIDIARIP